MKKKKKYIVKKLWMMGNNMSAKKYKLKMHSVFNNGARHTFRITDIVCIVGFGQYCIFYLRDKTEHHYAYNIAEVCLLLPGNHFGRHGKKCIINYHHVISVSRLPACKVDMKNGHVCVVSRDDVTRFSHIFKNFKWHQFH